MQHIIDQQNEIISQAYENGWNDKLEVKFIELWRQENLLISQK